MKNHLQVVSKSAHQNLFKFKQCESLQDSVLFPIDFVILTPRLDVQMIQIINSYEYEPFDLLLRKGSLKYPICSLQRVNAPPLEVHKSQ